MATSLCCHCVYCTLLHSYGWNAVLFAAPDKILDFLTNWLFFVVTRRPEKPAGLIRRSPSSTPGKRRNTAYCPSSCLWSSWSCCPCWWCWVHTCWLWSTEPGAFGWNPQHLDGTPSIWMEIEIKKRLKTEWTCPCEPAKKQQELSRCGERPLVQGIPTYRSHDCGPSSTFSTSYICFFMFVFWMFFLFMLA